MNSNEKIEKMFYNSTDEIDTFTLKEVDKLNQDIGDYIKKIYKIHEELPVPFSPRIFSETLANEMECICAARMIDVEAQGFIKGYRHAMGLVMAGIAPEEMEV